VSAVHCVTCADEAWVGRVLELDGLTALVAGDGRRERVALDLVAPVAVGDLLLCHAGIALDRSEAPA
jgi:hydrogenase maturation factor